LIQIEQASKSFSSFPMNLFTWTDRLFLWQFHIFVRHFQKYLDSDSLWVDLLLERYIYPSSDKHIMNSLHSYMRYPFFQNLIVLERIFSKRDERSHSKVDRCNSSFSLVRPSNLMKQAWILTWCGLNQFNESWSHKHDLAYSCQ
jgi:hypothetical protein